MVNILYSLLSGAIGSLISIIGMIVYYNRRDKYNEKLMLFQKLLGNRYDIKGEKFTEAINSIFVTFHGSKAVLKALKEFHETIINKSNTNEKIIDDKLLSLFKAICEDLNISIEPLGDSFFLEAFNVKKS